MKRKHRDRIIATQKAFKARQSATAKKTKESFRDVADKNISAGDAAKTVTTQGKGITTPNPQKGGADDNSHDDGSSGKSQKSSGLKQWTKLRNARRAVQREEDEEEETSSTCCA